MLTNLITQLIEDSRISSRPARRRLKNGLHMTVIQRAIAYTLILSRDKVYPSEQEWRTVLKHWPYHVEHTEPSRIVDSDRRMALKGEIPTVRYIQGQMFS